MICSSILVFTLVNPLAGSNELSVVKDHLTTVYEQSKLLIAVKNGFIPTREEIQQIQDMMLSWDGVKGPEDYEVFHSFADGMYTREMHVQKDEIIIGRIHRNEHIVNLLKGKLVVIDEFGNRMLEAPCSFTSKPGVKRIGFILEDTVWQDIHRTDKTTIEEAEKDIFIKDYSEIEIEV